MNYPPKHARFARSVVDHSVDLAAAASATTTLPVATADGPGKLLTFEIAAPGGLAANDSAYWTIQLKDTTSSTVLATWTTKTTGGGGQGALTANLQAAVAISAPVFALADQLAVVCTPTGSPSNLPAQTRFVVHTEQSA